MQQLAYKKKRAVSVIVTILNEEKSIQQLLMSLRQQTFPPTEVIITDAGSTDKTKQILAEFAKTHLDFPLQVILQPGNRSVGRNVAIEHATTELIAITDAGCVPALDWLEKLVTVYEQQSGKEPNLGTQGMVIAGYYQAQPRTPFEEAVVPYVLVMPDRVDPQNFLPATRSVMFDKKVWQVVGKFNQSFRWNEDYEFAQRLASHQIPIFFAGEAIVSWLPRENLQQFWFMIWHFAQGDVEARIWRTKVKLIFLRYLLLLGITMSALLSGRELFLLEFYLIGLFVYSAWAVGKNKKYVVHGKYWLPILQVLSDLAVMGGSLFGLIRQQKTLE